MHVHFKRAKHRASKLLCFSAVQVRRLFFFCFLFFFVLAFCGFFIWGSSPMFDKVYRFQVNNFNDLTTTVLLAESDSDNMFCFLVIRD